MMGRPTPSRRRFLSALAACSVTSAFEVAHAEDIAVPVDLQATLLAKVVPYDRNLAERAGDRVRTASWSADRSDPKSMPFVRQMRDALGAIGNFGSFAHEEQIVDFTSAAALLEKCRGERISVVYLGPGLRNDIEVIRDALEPLSILTVSANPEDVAAPHRSRLRPRFRQAQARRPLAPSPQATCPARRRGAQVDARHRCVGVAPRPRCPADGFARPRVACAKVSLPTGLGMLTL